MKSSMVIVALLAAASSKAFATPPVHGADALSLQANQNFARCVVDASPAAATRVLAMDFRTEGYRDALHKLIRGHDRCVTPGGKLRGGNLLFAGALADALLVNDISGSLPRALRYDPALPPIVSRGPSETMALCVVRRAPDAVAALVATRAGSAAEVAAGDPLMAQLPACLANGVSLQINRPGLRALVALAAYRIAAANGAVRGVGTSGAAN